MNAIITASYGLFAAARQFELSAHRVAEAPETADFAAEAVDQIQSSAAYTANLAVIRASSRMQQDALDILA